MFNIKEGAVIGINAINELADKLGFKTGTINVNDYKLVVSLTK